MKILNHKDAINRRQDKGLIIVETAINRVFWLNRTVLIVSWVLISDILVSLLARRCRCTTRRWSKFHSASGNHLL
ncbi:hypothetical protein LC613_11210 [Nostoc sphaeroides CHAB 2801]|uniref:hypothetical protein n=1 Tax=Nostoc sphaeroides TaxID=446679 RepID=UPI0015F30117|nr:hypothetical protein [Nostoc sphaeroides]MCC5628636.1 hypothetical protein [Nostoc sphaeroides CHAB 2801]